MPPWSPSGREVADATGVSPRDGSFPLSIEYQATENIYLIHLVEHYQTTEMGQFNLKNIVFLLNTHVCFATFKAQVTLKWFQHHPLAIRCQSVGFMVHKWPYSCRAVDSVDRKQI